MIHSIDHHLCFEEKREMEINRRHEVEFEAELGWQILSSNLPINFISESLMFSHRQKLYMLGLVSPYQIAMYSYDFKNDQFQFYSPRSLQPSSFYEMLPICLVHDQIVYLIPFEVKNERCIHSFNLVTYQWNKIPSPSSLFRITELDGCCFNKSLHLWSSQLPTVVHTYHIELGTWIISDCFGTFPTSSCGSSIVHQGKLLSFSNHAKKIYSLDLITFDWTVQETPGIGHFNPRRHTHLLQKKDDFLYFAPNFDDFNLIQFDLKTNSQRRLQTFGDNKLQNVYTEASFVILGNYIFTLDSFTRKNRLLCLYLDQYKCDHTNYFYNYELNDYQTDGSESDYMSSGSEDESDF